MIVLRTGIRLPNSALAFVALIVALAASAALSPALAGGLTGCETFLEKLRSEGGDLGVDFSHALVVSRSRSDANVFDITTKVEVEGALTCRGDRFVRFELHVGEPASARASSGFEKMQAIALRAALGWEANKIRSTLRDMAADVKDYLAASKERGDVYVAGKTEEHAPGDVSLGLIQTDIDRAFIIVGPTE